MLTRMLHLRHILGTFTTPVFLILLNISVSQTYEKNRTGRAFIITFNHYLVSAKAVYLICMEQILVLSRCIIQLVV